MACRHTVYEMPKALRKAIGAGQKCDTFEKVMALSGKPFRDVPGRKTSRVQILDKYYFVKQHFGVGWQEIFKNLLSFKKPTVSAMTEVNAIQRVTAIGISTTPLVAYGQRGLNPAKLQSFILTEDLGDIVSLEDLCADWQSNPPNLRFKRKLIIAVAKLARTLHEHRINHRDFYLCHLCINQKDIGQDNVNLYLIDLHRTQLHSKTSVRGNMKDIAALFFSAMDIGLTQKDLVRFKRYYANPDDEFWQQVVQRADKLYRKFNTDKFQQKLKAERNRLD